MTTNFKFGSDSDVVHTTPSDSPKICFLQLVGHFLWARRMCCVSSVVFVLRLAWFHLCNGLLGLVAFPCVVVGCALSLVLLPLCCLGLVVFRLLILLVGAFARVDVGLHNLISPPSQQFCVDRNGLFLTATTSGVARLSRDVTNCTPQALAAVFYFGTVKLLISALSLASLGMVVPLPTVAMNGADPVVVLGASVLVMLLGVALMWIVAKISTSVTRCFCCEQLAIYQYVPLAQPVHGPHYTLCIDRD